MSTHYDRMVERITGPAPSAGQDTERLRDEKSVNLTPGVVWTDSQLDVLRGLVGNLHKTRLERDEARATVQRVTNVLRHIEETPVEPDAVLYALDLRDTLRGALDGKVAE